MKEKNIKKLTIKNYFIKNIILILILTGLTIHVYAFLQTNQLIKENDAQSQNFQLFYNQTTNLRINIYPGIRTKINLSSVRQSTFNLTLNEYDAINSSFIPTNKTNISTFHTQFSKTHVTTIIIILYQSHLKKQVHDGIIHYTQEIVNLTFQSQNKGYITEIPHIGSIMIFIGVILYSFSVLVQNIPISKHRRYFVPSFYKRSTISNLKQKIDLQKKILNIDNTDTFYLFIFLFLCLILLRMNNLYQIDLSDPSIFSTFVNISITNDIQNLLLIFLLFTYIIAYRSLSLRESNTQTFFLTLPLGYQRIALFIYLRNLKYFLFYAIFYSFLISYLIVLPLGLRNSLAYFTATFLVFLLIYFLAFAPVVFINSFNYSLYTSLILTIAIILVLNFILSFVLSFSVINSYVQIVSCLIFPCTQNMLLGFLILSVSLVILTLIGFYRNKLILE